jgi:hypothetical protein
MFGPEPGFSPLLDDRLRAISRTNQKKGRKEEARKEG